ncbi:MAG: FliM/FliN family flagellar motor switch protein [Pseudomonadota bacterium]
MTLLSEKAEAVPVSLLRKCDDTPAFPGMNRIGERFARALGNVIVGAGADKATVTFDAIKLKSFGEWRDAQNGGGALCRYHLPPMKGAMLIAIPAEFVIHMVDLFYGGAGEISNVRSEFTAAECRYIRRFGEQCLPSLALAWADVVTLSPVFSGDEYEISNAKLGKDIDLVAVQSFSMVIGAGTPMSLACIYPVAALRAFEALSDAPQTEMSSNADPVWRERLSEAVSQVRLPMRSIFARPELPLSQLLSIKPGDVIPVCLPSHIPITVAGRLFAQGSVGESNGRAAIKIEKIEQGQTRYE